MYRRSLSAILAIALTATMSFAMLGEVFAASEETSAEVAANELEIEFVDSMEALDADLEVVSVAELPYGNALESRVVSDIVISGESNMGEELRSSRADGINVESSNQSVTYNLKGTIDAEDAVSYVPVTLAPGDILQATLKLPNNANLDYDLLLYAFDNDTLGDYLKGSTLTTYMNAYPNGVTKTVDEAVAYINEDNVNHTYALIVYPEKGYSPTESFELTVSIDEAGYYDASEPNESPFDVKTVSSNTSIVGNNLNVINDQDWFVIKTTGANKMGFTVSEGSYSVEVYRAIDTSMVLINPEAGVYNTDEGYYYIKVFNKSTDFVSKDYSLEVLTHGGIPSRILVYYDGDMDLQQFSYGYGTLYAFQYTLLPAARVFDRYGNRVANVDVTLEWIGDTAISPNNGHASQTLTTDASGFVKFRLRTPRAHGIHLTNTNSYDHDYMKISCENSAQGMYLYHMRNR